nr:transglutaminase domain-containing protein [Methanobacteriaceae archaeon]
MVITMVPAFSGLFDQEMIYNNAETVSNGDLSQGNNINKNENEIEEKIPIKTADDELTGSTSRDESSVLSHLFNGNTVSATSQVKAVTSYQRTTQSPVRYGSSTISNYGIILRPELSNLSGLSGLSKLAAFINQNFNHRYGAATTASGVERTGYGDCWGLSAWSAQVLVKNGYDVRIVQGPSRESARHRWLEVLVDGKYVRFDPTMVTKKYGSKHYSTNIATKTSIVASYKGEIKEETTNQSTSTSQSTNTVTNNNSAEDSGSVTKTTNVSETSNVEVNNHLENSLEKVDTLNIQENSSSVNNVEPITESGNAEEVTELAE